MTTSRFGFTHVGGLRKIYEVHLRETGEVLGDVWQGAGAMWRAETPDGTTVATHAASRDTAAGCLLAAHREAAR